MACKPCNTSRGLIPCVFFILVSFWSSCFEKKVSMKTWLELSALSLGKFSVNVWPLPNSELGERKIVVSLDRSLCRSLICITHEIRSHFFCSVTWLRGSTPKQNILAQNLASCVAWQLISQVSTWNAFNLLSCVETLKILSKITYVRFFFPEHDFI